jgi:hypothetical protein
LTGAENPVRDLYDEFGPGPVHRIAYRRKFILALNVKFRRGQISKADYWKLRRASYNPAFMDAFIDEIENAAKAAGDWLEDVQAWFKVLVDWLIENWETVLKVALTLIMLVL